MINHFDRIKASVGALSPADFDSKNFEVKLLDEPDSFGRKQFAVKAKTMDGLRALRQAGIVNTVLA